MAPTWLFDLGADLYAGYTDNPAWRASCGDLAGHLAPPLGRVLDLGCGPGTTITALAERLPGVRWVGGDLAGRMLRLARRRLAGRGVDGALLRLDALRLPLATASLDAVIGHSFLYLVADDLAVLREARRVLRQGGRAAFMEPAAGYVPPARVFGVSADPRFLASIPPWRVMSRRHRRYTPAEFGQVLAAAGFGDIRYQAVLGGLGLIASGAAGG